MIGLIETKKNAKTYEISAFLAPPSRVELLAFRLGGEPSIQLRYGGL